MEREGANIICCLGRKLALGKARRRCRRRRWPHAVAEISITVQLASSAATLAAVHSGLATTERAASHVQSFEPKRTRQRGRPRGSLSRGRFIAQHPSDKLAGWPRPELNGQTSRGVCLLFGSSARLPKLDETEKGGWHERRKHERRNLLLESRRALVAVGFFARSRRPRLTLSALGRTESKRANMEPIHSTFLQWWRRHRLSNTVRPSVSKSVQSATNLPLHLRATPHTHSYIRKT